ncbi:MAG: hypothetical protein ACK5M0_06825 [Bacteroidales bacterium]
MSRRNLSLDDLLGEKGVNNFGKAIIESIEDLGLGLLSKSDFEAYMFHHIVENLPRDKRDSFTLMQLLKITPSKLKSLEMIRSAKYLSIEINESSITAIIKALEGKNVEVEDKDNGKIRIYIDDNHVFRLIERIIVENGSSVDYKQNNKQLVIKYSEFLKLMEILIKYKDENSSLLKLVNEDKSIFELDKKIKPEENIFKVLETRLKEKAYDEVGSMIIKGIIKIVSSKFL